MQEETAAPVFGEEYPDDNCRACDICTGSVEQIDITVDSQIIMSAISRTQQRFGIGHVIDIVTGADTKRVRELKHHEIKPTAPEDTKTKSTGGFLLMNSLHRALSGRKEILTLY